MIERKAIKAPLPCFGIDYSERDDKCRRCPHKQKCLEFYPYKNRVLLSKATFDILPEKLKKDKDLEGDNTEQIYCFQHEQVFGDWPYKKLHPDVIRLIDTTCQTLSCDVAVYVKTAMLAFKLQNDRDAKFYPSYLKNQGLTAWKTYASHLRNT